MVYFITFILWSAISTHDIHLSVTEISMEEEKIIVVSKIFLDDLQFAMGLVPGEELPEDYEGSDQLIQRFIDENLQISLGDDVLDLKLTSTEPALPAIWATFEANYTIEGDEIQNQQWSVSVMNKMMIELFDDQKNITKIDVNGSTQQEIFDTKKTSKTFSF